MNGLYLVYDTLKYVYKVRKKGSNKVLAKIKHVPKKGYQIKVTDSRYMYDVYKLLYKSNALHHIFDSPLNVEYSSLKRKKL